MRSVALCDGKNANSGSALLERTLVPDEIAALLTRDEEVESPVTADVDGANVVGCLVLTDDVRRELSLAVVFEPRGDLVVLGASRRVDVTVAVDIRDGEAVRAVERLVDGAALPRRLRVARRLEPDDSSAMATRADEVDLAIAVDVDGMDVRRTELLRRDRVLLPSRLRVLRGFPPREPITAVRWRRRTTLCGARGVGATVTVDVSEAEVVAEARRVAIGEGVDGPALCVTRILRRR